MEQFKQRLYKEESQLEEKIRRAEDFMITAKYHELSSTDKTLLEWQVLAMRFYRSFLRIRIRRLTTREDWEEAMRNDLTFPTHETMTEQ